MPFTNEPWDGGAVESGQDAESFCKCCLVDLNPAGKAKVKALCKLPVRATPGGPYNVNSMIACASVLAGGRGGMDAPAEAKRKAAKRLLSLYAELGKPAPGELRRIAGMRAE